MLGPVHARRLRVIALSATVVIAVSAPAARATIVDRGSFSGSETDVPEEVCGLALVRDTTFSGDFRIRVDKQSGGQAFFQHLLFEYRDVFTNPANGKTMTIEGRSLNNELTARHVEGNVYEFTTIEAGQPFVVRDGSGRVVLRDRGVIRRHILFDTLGDSTPGGEILDEEIVGVGGPHPGFDQTEEEFCAMVIALVG